jgi:hypothetical protein
LLDILAAISAVTVALLSLGFLGRVELNLVHISLAPPVYAGQQDVLAIEDGRVVSRWASASGLPLTPGVLGIHAGYHVAPAMDLWPLRAADWPRTIWQFDAHWLAVGGAGPPIFILACPIWCVMVPMLIAPALWIRKRRKRRVARGFAVRTTGVGETQP